MTRKQGAPAWRRYLRFFDENVEADIDDELRFHLEMRAQEMIRRGVSPHDARRLALERFGDVEAARHGCATIGREQLRAERRRAVLVDLAQDIGYAFRILQRQRLPAVIIVLCLALGIGSTTTVFSVGDALLLRPLPFPNGPRLVYLGPSFSSMRGMGVSSFEDFRDWQRRQHTFEALGAIQRESYTIGGSEPISVSGATITSSVFRTLGVRPERGRLLLPSDDAPGAPRVVVVTAGFADRVLGGVDRAVGQKLLVNGRLRGGTRGGVAPILEVVGVLPDRYAYPEGVQLWGSMPRAEIPNDRSSRSLDLIGALREGVAIDAARRDLVAISQQLAAEHPDHDTGMSAVVRPLRERYVGAARPAFVAVAAAAVFLLLIACANVASLQLARASARAREIAVRTALGAARGRLLRLLLTESVILAVVGGGLGVALAYAASHVVAASIPARVAPWMTPVIDARVLTFTVLVSVLSGISFGMAPALRLARVAPARMLHGGARGGVDPRRMALQRMLVVAEIALSLVLLVGATFAARSVARLTRIDPGFDPRGVFTFRLAMQGPQYDSASSRVRLAEQLVERLAAMPGVEAVGAVSHLPIADCCSRWGLTPEGEVRDRSHERMVTGSVVTPEYFRALRIGLVRGRYLTSADRQGAEPVLVINETFQRELFHGQDALGKIVHIGSRDAIVVGVVRDIKQTRLVDGPEPQFYWTQAQMAWDMLTVAVRLRPAVRGSIVPDARRAMRALDPSIPLTRAVPMTELMDRAIVSQKMFSKLLEGFAVIAIVLATAGIYGVTAYYVVQRSSEMGIRMALGARPASLRELVMRQAATLAAIGLVLGMGGAFLSARGLTRTLYGVSAGEPIVYAIAGAVLAATALVACLGPARRVTRVDPMVALRME